MLGDPKVASKEGNQIFDPTFTDVETGTVGAWRHVTVADRLCNPNQDMKSLMFAKEDELSRAKKQQQAPFNLGCKVPEHDGPLAEGIVKKVSYSVPKVSYYVQKVSFSVQKVLNFVQKVLYFV